MLSEISQSQNNKYCMTPLLEISRVVKFVETESRMVVAESRGWGERNGELLVKGHKFPILEDEKTYGDGW